jgi:hypothetical protein
MFKFFYMLVVAACVSSAGCVDGINLAESSFGKPSHLSSKASAASVISMGRDDDDGAAKKWHIGGSEDQD